MAHLSTAARIRQARRERSLSQMALAKRLGLGPYGQVTVSRWENGHQEPARDSLLKLARTLGVSVDWLVGR